mmetsp:Transcript_2001/g.5720  ORF Transcript_2001/g.5720 Transcript_2001/m.5720 type:complete len:214 (+) Transcript_2001:554-1195(+)
MMHFSPRPPGQSTASRGPGSAAQRKEAHTSLRLRSVVRASRSSVALDVTPREPVDAARMLSSRVSSVATVATALASTDRKGKKRKNSAEIRAGAWGRMKWIIDGASTAKAVAAAPTPTQKGSGALDRSAAAAYVSASAVAWSAPAASSLPPATDTLPTYSKVSPSAAASAAAVGMTISPSFSSSTKGADAEEKVSASRTRSSPSESLRSLPAS